MIRQSTMRLQDACQLCCFVLLSFYVSLTATLPIQSTVSNNRLSNSSPIELRILTFANDAHTLLQPRASDFMSQLKFGWIYRLTQFDSYFPIRTAATTMANFYRDTIYNAEHVWPVALPTSDLKITQGAITLKLSCKEKTIPWSMVKSIAQDFLKATEEGVTGRFEGRFIWAATGVTIYVSLKVNALMTV